MESREKGPLRRRDRDFDARKGEIVDEEEGEVAEAEEVAEGRGGRISSPAAASVLLLLLPNRDREDLLMSIALVVGSFTKISLSLSAEPIWKA